jgi:predicted acylesterase/phospholipase RssA
MKGKRPKIIKELCFSGGHFNSLLTFIGALKAIHDGNLFDLSCVERYLGTSSGAILAFLLALNYKLDTILNVLKKIPTEKCFEIKSENFLYLFDDLGIYDTKKFKTLFEIIIEHKGFSKNLTFKTFFDKTGKDLSFTSYCVNSKDIVILNHVFTPQLKISKALCMSMAIPLVCKPVSYQNQLYIDPCLICNFPIDYVKYESYLGFGSESVKKYVENQNFLSLLRTLYESIYREILDIKTLQYENDHIFILNCP